MSKHIQMSEAASIGIHSLALISNCETNFANVDIISVQTKVNKYYIDNVMHTLGKYGFVSSVCCSAGGFSFAMDADEINLLDIYETIEGNISINKFHIDKPIYLFNKCLMGGIFLKITDVLIASLKSHKLSDMLHFYNN